MSKTLYLIAASSLLPLVALAQNTNWEGDFQGWGQGDWSTASNWDNGIPTFTTNATISGDRCLVNISGTASANNIIFTGNGFAESGITVMGAPSAILNVAGDININMGSSAYPDVSINMPTVNVGGNVNVNEGFFDLINTGNFNAVGDINISGDATFSTEAVNVSARYLNMSADSSYRIYDSGVHTFKGLRGTGALTTAPIYVPATIIINTESNVTNEFTFENSPAPGLSIKITGAGTQIFSDSAINNITIQSGTGQLTRSSVAKLTLESTGQLRFENSKVTESLTINGNNTAILFDLDDPSNVIKFGSAASLTYGHINFDFTGGEAGEIYTIMLADGSASPAWSINSISDLTALGTQGTFTINNDPSGHLQSLQFTVTPVPEPSTYALIGSSLVLGFAALRRRRK